MERLACDDCNRWIESVVAEELFNTPINSRFGINSTPYLLANRR